MPQPQLPATTEAEARPTAAPEPTSILDDEESEYETDTDAEPEEFYITLDLTVPAPVQAGPSTNPYTNASLKKSAITGNTVPIPTKSTPMLGASRSQAPRQLPKWARGSAPRKDRIQLLDLDGDEVLVNFQNRVWAGRWARTVGTEVLINAPMREEEEEEGETDGADHEGIARDLPRASGGGYYYSEKDFSAAAPLIGGRRRTHHKPLHASVSADGEVQGVLLDPEVGKVIALGRDRIHFAPAAVKAKEWSFAEQLQGKSDFLKRLERIQIARGEMEREQALHQDGRKRRRRRKKDGEEWVWVSESETDEEEGPEGDGQGYFSRRRQRQTGEPSSPPPPDEDVDMQDAPSS